MPGGVTGVGGHEFYEGMAAGQEPLSGDIAYDANGGVIRAKVTTVPSDATSGYAKGGVVIDTDSTTPGSILFLNEGTFASSDFNGVVTSASLTTSLSSYLPLAGGTMVEASTIALGTTTGTKIGGAVTQKLGFWNATPVVQPASANQGALGTATTVGSNTGTAGAGLSLIGDTTSVNQATNLMNDLKALQEDIAALFTLVTAMRTALVNTGIIKGAA